MRPSFLALTAVLSVAALSIAGTASPQAEATTTPPPMKVDTEQTIGDIGIGCTGIGDSRHDARWQAYPIRLEFSNSGADLLANVAVRLSTGSGRLLATVSCEGSWVMVRAAPGTYRVEAWMPGRDLKHQSATFSPPAGGQKIVELRFPEA